MGICSPGTQNPDAYFPRNVYWLSGWLRGNVRLNDVPVDIRAMAVLFFDRIWLRSSDYFDARAWYHVPIELR